MIGVNFKGRLGNQLFQFYFLQYLKSNRTVYRFFFFPNPHHAQSLTKYFDLGWYYNITLGSKIYSLVMRSLPLIFKLKELQLYNFSAPRVLCPQNNTIYNGYFQSDWYLKNTPNPPQIKVKKKYAKAFQQKFGSVFSSNKTICVHIRLTDYKNFMDRDLSLPISFFKEQLSKIENIESYKIFFVSDDIEFVKSEFPNNENYIFSSNDEITDFQLIQHADIAIISNSTFAWWASYLSTKTEIVIAPQYWLGFRIGTEFPKGIMTQRFSWAKVN